MRQVDLDKEYIACSAIWYKSGVEHPRGTFTMNITNGEVICGWRHGNVIAVRATNPARNGGIDSVQGFLTNRGRFVDRWQGMQIAHEAGQVPDKVALNSSWDGSNDGYFTSGESLSAEPVDIMDQLDKSKRKYNMMFSEDIY